MTSTIVWLIVIAVIVGVVAVVFFWYQFRRARASFQSLDHSKLRDLDEDGWDDDWKR